MTANEDQDDAMLDALFAQAADELPELSPTLTSRILADANAAKPTHRSSAAAPSVLRSFLNELGGWPSIGSLATAAVTGLYIGFASPDLVFVVAEAETETSTEQEDMLDGYLDSGDYFFEGT